MLTRPFVFWPLPAFPALLLAIHIELLQPSRALCHDCCAFELGYVWFFLHGMVSLPTFPDWIITHGVLRPTPAHLLWTTFPNTPSLGFASFLHNLSPLCHFSLLSFYLLIYLAYKIWITRNSSSMPKIPKVLNTHLLNIWVSEQMNLHLENRSVTLSKLAGNKKNYTREGHNKGCGNQTWFIILMLEEKAFQLLLLLWGKFCYRLLR